MKWTRIRIKTLTDAENIIISELYDYGLEGAQIEDKIPLSPLEKEQMFVDILPETEEDDGIAYLSFFVEEGTMDIASLLKDVESVLEGIREYCEIGAGEITVDETEDLDWINNWKKFFHQFTVDDLLVIPSWEDIEPDLSYEKILHIDPGTAFGTGMHETTQLCIRAIKKYLNKETQLLDVGTGSGILSIVALMYGADYCFGTDLDPCAIEAVRKNKADNNIPDEKFTLHIGNIIDDKATQDLAGYNKYDIVVANILAPVLIALTPIIKEAMKPGAVYITSGIIESWVDRVKDACEESGLTVIDTSKQGEWVSITARKEA